MGMLLAIIQEPVDLLPEELGEGNLLTSRRNVVVMKKMMSQRK